MALLKNATSGVLAAWSCSRTHPYAPLTQAAAALLDDIFEQSFPLLSRLDNGPG